MPSLVLITWPVVSSLSLTEPKTMAKSGIAKKEDDHCTMAKGLSLKRKNQEMFNIENWFRRQFSSNTWFFWQRLSQHPKNWKTQKEFTNINLGGFKTQKTWRGCFSRIKRVSKFWFLYICYDICFHNLCEKHPLMGKKRF